MIAYKRTIAVVILLVSVTVPLRGYEIEVHKTMTQRAMERALSAVSTQAQLGIPATTTVSGESLTEWSVRGSRDEDDILQSFPPFRSVNHFFDPANGAPLTVGVWPFCTSVIVFPGTIVAARSVRADEWALEPQFLNDWGLPKARQYQYDAVMGPNPGTRDTNIRDLFLSLGHMVHLVQDMAQPEHTRNDQHLPVLKSNASLYEKWTLTSLVEPEAIPGADTFFDGYETVRLPSFAGYFHTADGKGMADYANSNFVTQDTNYDDERSPLKCFRYTKPDITDPTTTFRLEDVREMVKDGAGKEFFEDVAEWVYTSRPVDRYRGGATDIDAYHTVVSSLDLETRKYDPFASVYSLAPNSYLTRASLLVPRAVGYSAGFIEHFFRGKIDATWKRIGPGAYELTITNQSTETIGADAKISALFRADPSYFARTNSDDTGAILRNAELRELVPGFSGLAPGASVTLTLQFFFGLKDTDEITKFERRIVITGTLGDERDAVIGLVQSPASGLVAEMLVTNCGTTNASFQVIPVPATGFRAEQRVHVFFPEGPNRMCADPNNPMHAKNACIERLPNDPNNPGTKGARVTINPYDSGRTHIFTIVTSNPNVIVGCTLSWTISVDGTVVRTRKLVQSIADPNLFALGDSVTYPANP